MNVNRRWLGTSVVRVRVLAAGLVVLGAGCAVLGWGSRSGQSAAGVGANVTANPAAMNIAANQTPATASPSLASAEMQSRARSVFAGLPLIFEPNLGQGNLDPADRRGKFVTRGPGYSLFLGSEGAILSTVSQSQSKLDSRKHAASVARVNSLQMRLAGANPNARLTGADLLPGKSNYFLGNDPAKWRHSVPQFARVRYENIYPGINLVFYGNQGRLEYDFQVAPGADPAQAELEFNGAQQLQLKDGALVIRREGGSVQLQAPRIYQEIAGRQQPVEGSFVLRGSNRAGFAIGPYDHSRELVIDPILSFATYFGGSGDERATSIAIDGSFNIYLAGSTTSPNLPAIGVFQTALAAGATQNVYIAKIQPPLGQQPAVLDYVTYLGGNGTDTPVGISVDSRGDPYVAGTTSSSNFPTTVSNAYQSTPEVPGTHVFVTELLYDATTLQYSSYLSGNGTDIATGMTIDASGNLYVTGTTTSSDAASTTDQFPASTLPEALPFQNAPRSSIQFFVTKVNTNAPSIGSIAYSTYFGGGSFATPTPIAVGGGIAVDTNGNVYFTGTTNFQYTGSSSSTDFPILNPYQACLDQPPTGPIVNPPLCSYVAPVPPPLDPDAFVTKLNPNAPQGEQLIWSTYLGGSATDSGAGIAIDTGAANVYVVGTTNSTDINTGIATLNTSAAYQQCLDQPVNPASGVQCALTATGGPYPNDAFVARLSNPTPTSGTVQNNVTLNYFSYLGGAANEAGLAIAVDSASGALVTGWTQSSGLPGSGTAFPVFPPSTIQSSLTGAQDAFLARLNTAAQLGQTNGSWATYYGGGNTDGNAVFTEGTGVALDVNQNAYFAGDTNSTTLQVQNPLVTASTAVNNLTGYNGGYDAFATQLSSALSLSVTGVLTLGPNQSFVDAGNQATFTYTITNNGPDQASNITVLDNLSSTGVVLSFDSASASAGTCGGGSTNTSVSCSLPTLQSGATATVTIVVTPTPNSAGTQETFNGGTVQVMGTGNNVLARTQVPAQMGDYTIDVNPANNTVPAGQTAKYEVVLSPHPVYSSKITLSCSGLPTGAACNFTNSPVTLSGPGSSTLNLTTTARPILPTTASLWTRHFYAVWLALPGLTLLGVGAGSNRRRRRILGIFLFCALFALLLLQPACSGSNTQLPVSGTPAGTYPVTITAVSGTDTKSSVVTLNVQ